MGLGGIVDCWGITLWRVARCALVEETEVEIIECRAEVSRVLLTENADLLAGSPFFRAEDTAKDMDYGMKQHFETFLRRPPCSARA